MALKGIKLQVINILGTPDMYITRFCDSFSSSRILNEGETFNKVVEKEVAYLIETGFEGRIEDIEWVDETDASIRFEENEFTVEFSLIVHYVTINID